MLAERASCSLPRHWLLPRTAATRFHFEQVWMTSLTDYPRAEGFSNSRGYGVCAVLRNVHRNKHGQITERLPNGAYDGKPGLSPRWVSAAFRLHADCHKRLEPGVGCLQLCGGWGDPTVAFGWWALNCVDGFGAFLASLATPRQDISQYPHSKLSHCLAETLPLLPSTPSSSHDAQLQDLGRSGSPVVSL